MYTYYIFYMYQFTELQQPYEVGKIIISYFF